jgi:hypothetical protein
MPKCWSTEEQSSSFHLLQNCTPAGYDKLPFQVWYNINTTNSHVQCSKHKRGAINIIIWTLRPVCTMLRTGRSRVRSLTVSLEFFSDINLLVSGFGGLGVSALAFGTQVRGFKPSRSRQIFLGEKILSAPSFRREVKPWVPCRWFTACKRSLDVSWKSASWQN